MSSSKVSAVPVPESDELVFADDSQESKPEPEASTAAAWQILIVDDEPEVHQITKLALRSVNFSERGLNFTSAKSAAEAREILSKRQDFALAIVDVIMETDEAGLGLVRHIREDLRNKKMRIVLRTGQPGMHQERDVMIGYDINDYKTKTELTKEKLESTVIASLRTVSHIERIEDLHEKLLLSQKLSTIGEFSMGIVHEIATPLSTLLCVVDLMRDGMGTNGEIGDYTARIQRAGHRIKRLIDNLKDFTWSGGDNRRQTEARELVTNALEFCQFKIRKANLAVEVVLPDEQLSFSCMQRQVEQVLINLINNACDAVADAKEKKLRISVTAVDREIHVEVQDSGPGIPPAIAERIFDSFFTTKPKGQGTGLGLFISKSIAEEHGGSFTLLPATGQGATFRLALPRLG